MSSTPDLSRLHVLLAEDNETNLMVAREMLERLGARVSVARDGIVALELAEREQPDVILLDVEMPRLSGLDVLRRLAEREIAIPTICLTAHVGTEHVERVLELGAIGAIGKPIGSLDSFGRRILDLMETGAGGTNAEPGLAVLDLTVFRPMAEMMGEPMVGTLLEQVETDLAGALETLDSAVRGRDVAVIRAQSHVLTGVAGTIGGMRLRSIARTMNRAAHDGDFVTISSCFTQLPVEISALIQAIGVERRT
ncbi:response regulator [Pontivivens ytuae]|uniref:Response regulator n=1 Tax=Pontivivens ytuae TaxID=2789856 RepID=A0A7S9LTP3_9RHOB|nr:response regulator [Pontivivens ytuae]QPH55127.1 response regulator [Pontivivens ytuae]